MKSKLLGVAVISLVFVLSAIAAAQPVNYFPQQFYGTVTVNGAPAPDGMLVSAKFEGKDVGGTLTSGGSYNLIIAMKDEDEGQTVTFYVQNVDTGIQSTFEGGASVRLDLSATVSLPSPPPSGGGGSSGGGSSGGGGTSVGSGTCTESWICTDWTECSNYVQKRVCADVNMCNTTVNKPAERQDCVMPTICQAGEKKCEGNSVFVCSALGTTWIEEKVCEKGCSNGVCGEDLAAAGPATAGAGAALTGFFLLEPSAWPYWIVIIVIIVVLVWFFLLRKNPGKVSK